jgi:hypothetical protein
MAAFPALRPMMERLRRDGAWLAVALGALAFLAVHFLQALTTLPDMAQPMNGSAWAPHSDALGPWLEGGLAYLFGLPPPFYLYRPTVGIFWGSILAATARIEWIPLFFVLWILATGATLAFSAADRALRAALVLTLAYAAIRFPQTWATVGLDVDLASLALTFSGILLFLWDRGRWADAAFAVGCACLGAAAAIRGPMMIAGPVLIAIRLLRMERVSVRVLAVAALLFMAPIVFDVGLQDRYGIGSNGMQVLYCIYWDPSHSWTPACTADYWKRLPLSSEVARKFLAFRFSPDGLQLLASHVFWRTARDLALVHSPATYALMLGIMALESGYRVQATRSITPFVRAVLIVAALMAIGSRAVAHTWAPFAGIAIATLVAFGTRDWRALLCFAAYLASILFVATLGLVFHDRLINTFAFTLVLGIGLLAMGDRHPTGEAQPAARPALLGVTALTLVFLYAGAFILPATLRDTYLREVYKREGMAVKIGDDPRIDRSLYYPYLRQFIYTRHDDLPLGTVRSYRDTVNNRSGNVSFTSPNAFRD